MQISWSTMTNHKPIPNGNATDKLLKFLTFAVLAGCATVITYVMTTSTYLTP